MSTLDDQIESLKRTEHERCLVSAISLLEHNGAIAPNIGEQLRESVAALAKGQLPAPPAPEPTQGALDQRAHDAWIDGEGEECQTTTGIWHAAIAYRDAQNRADWESGPYVSSQASGGEPMETWNAKHLARLRKRCGLA